MDQYFNLTNQIRGLRDDVDGWKEVSPQAMEYGSREDLIQALEGSLAILDATTDLATNIIADIMVAKMRFEADQASTSGKSNKPLDT